MTDEEMKIVESEEHTDEEIQIDESPQTFIPPKEPAQGLAAPAEEFGSSTKQTPQAEENQGEDPQPEENPNPEQNTQPEAQDEEIPPPEQNPQPDAHAEENPHPEQNPQPEAQADEIPHPEEHAEENAPAPNTETAIVVVNPETAMIVSPQGKQQTFSPCSVSPSPSGQKNGVNMYDECELPNKLMEVLMKPLAKGQPPRTTFLVHELKYEPRTVYRILCSVLAPIKGHDDEEDVVGIMKNILLNIIHGIPINLHDFFLRTMADNAMSPFDLKIYATWIMRFIRRRSGINYHANFNNHIGYMPPIRVNKKTFEPVEGKGKSVIDEGGQPLDGQFREPDAYSSRDDTEAQPPSPVAPRVMNTRELLLSLHQKVDRNHKCVKRQFGAIVKTLNETQNAVKLNHHYLHEVFDRTWATQAHLKTPAELQELEFTQDFDSSWPPKKKFRPIPVPDLEDSSFSSFRTSKSDEEQQDTTTSPRRKPAPKNPHVSSSTAKK
ncbi:hypothetical protein ZWY2020_010937 [Hordeum vulgare]|nr:hypothetical protein ZWY2020_010937 [Hordeum vulgare]